MLFNQLQAERFVYDSHPLVMYMHVVSWLVPLLFLVSWVPTHRHSITTFLSPFFPDITRQSYVESDQF